MSGASAGPPVQAQPAGAAATGGPVPPLAVPRILHGRDVLPADPRTLRAGTLAAALDGAWLRWVRAGDVEVLRALYGAVRDPAWNTVEPVIHDVAVSETPGRVRVEFDADCVADGIDFAWHGTIQVEDPGSVTFEMDGLARAACLVGRVGICILHPDTVAGSELVAETAHGDVVTRFPTDIEPSRWLTDVVGMRWPAAPGLEAHLALEGDLFEVEDQRNWTDASFKTFSRPLRLPWPYRLEAGERVHQVARLELTGERRPARSGVARSRVEIGDAERPMPALGVDWPRDGRPFSAAESEAIRTLRPAHLRVVLDLASAGWPERLAGARADAAGVDAALEIEAIGDPGDRAWADLATTVAHRPPDVGRVLVFDTTAYDTTSGVLRAARAAFAGTDIPIGGGSRENFAELNRTSLRLDDLDVVSFPIAAQCHASDEASIVETLRGQAATARRAGELARGRPVVVGPVLLRPLAAAGADAYRGVIADPRQASLFIAGWLVGSVDALAAADVAAVTYFEAVGRAGLMDRSDAGAARWLSPGALFPAFHVLRALGGGGHRREAIVSGGHPILATAVRRGAALTILVANVGFASQAVTVGIPDLQDRRLAILDERSVPAACLDSRWFESASSPLAGPSDAVALELPRMAVAAITGSLR